MIRRVKYLIIAILVSTVLVTVPVMEAKADVATVTVVGGTLGTIGAGLSALLPPAAVILTVGLACAGIDIYISQASEEQGLTKTEFVEQQIYNYSQLTNQSTEEIAKGLLNGVSVAKDGTLYLGQSALNKIKQIGNWITGNTANNYVVEIPNIVEGYYIGNVPSVACYDGIYLSRPRTNSSGQDRTDHCQINGINNAYLFQWDTGTSYNFVVLSENTFSGSYRLTGGVAASNNNFRSNNSYFWKYNYIGLGGTIDIPYPDIPIVNIPDNNISGFISGLSHDVSQVLGQSNDTFVGGDWSDFVPGLALPDGYTGAIDTNILQDIIDELDLGTSYDLTVDNFLEAIKEAINEGVADIPLSIPADGTMVVAPDIPIILTPEYEQVAPVDIPAESDRTIVIDDEALAPTQDIIDDMKLQLKDVFPFCIPFDIYDILSKFNATPEAPRIVVDFTLPLVNQHVNYTFDLSPFNDVASVLRVMELVATVVGLAIATRSIFIRA